MKSKNLSIAIAALFLVMGFFVYFNSLHHPFMLDDHEFFDDKKVNIKFITYQFIPDKEQGIVLGMQTHEAYYRPLAHVIPMMSFLAFHENVFGHHLVNLLLFTIAAFCVYMLIYKLFLNQMLSFFSAFFYLVHPINGVMVNDITASVFAVQVICMSLSLLFAVSLQANAVSGAISLFFFVLALMCHESAMALPFYILATLLIVRRYSFKDAFLKTLPSLIFLLVYFLFRLKFASLNTGILEHYSLFKMNFGEYLASVTKLLVWYLHQLIFPDGIVLIWATHVVREWAFWWVVALVLLLSGWMGGMRYFWKENNSAAVLGLAWLGIGFGPLFFACLFQPTRALIIEPHWFVFSVIGFFILLSSILVASQEAIATKKSLFLFFILIIPWIIASHIYNTIWSDEIKYCYYWQNQAPAFSGAIAFHLAKAYELKRDFSQAKYYYKQGLTSHPNDWLRYHSQLGLIALSQGQWQEAKEHFIDALRINPSSAGNLNNLGAFYMREGDNRSAEQLFIKAMTSDPYFILPRMNLASIYIGEGKSILAIETYKGVLNIVPDEEMALIGLLKIYWDQKNREKVIEIARHLKAISHSELTQHNVRIIFQSLGLGTDGQDRSHY